MRGKKDLRRLAEAVEQGKQDHANSCGDKGIEQKVQREKRHRAREQNAFGDCENNLMEMEQDEDEPEPAYGMLRIDSRPDGRGDISNARFRNTVHANGIVVAQCVLRNADRRSQQHAAHRISPAHAEINCDEQWQVDEFRPAAVLVKERLQDERQKTNERNSSAVVFVYFDIRFRLCAGAQHRSQVIDVERPGGPRPYCLKQRPKRCRN
jgi:hypothetical protein